MRNILTRVVILTAISQGAGFVKLLLIAHYFGVSASLDGYYLALILPTLLAGVFGGAIQTGFFPVHARLRADGHSQIAQAVQSGLLWLLLIFTASCSLIIAIFAATIMKSIAGNAPDHVISASIICLKILAFTFALNSIVDYLGFVLAAHLRFALAAIAPAANALVGGLVLYAWPEWGLQSLIWGTLLGITVQVGILAFGLSKTDICIVLPWKLRRGWGAPAKEAIKLGAWLIPGMLFANLGAAVPQLLAAQYGEGAVSAFGYAQRLHGTMVQILVMSLSTVLLAKFSDQIASGKEKELADDLARGFPIALLLGLLISVWVWGVGPDLLKLVFQHGQFDTFATEQVFVLWFWLSLGLFPTLWGAVLAKVFQARKNPKFMSVLALIQLLALLVTALILSRKLELSSVAAAIGVSYLIGAFVFQFRLFRLISTERFNWLSFCRQSVFPFAATLFAVFFTLAVESALTLSSKVVAVTAVFLLFFYMAFRFNLSRSRN